MKKWKLSKNKNKKNTKSPKKEENENKEELRQIGTYYDFLIFDKIGKYKDNNYEFQNCKDDPSLKDWMMINISSDKTKSRFSNLFEEMGENDKKKANEEKKDENNKQKIIEDNNTKANNDDNIIKTSDNKIINNTNNDNNNIINKDSINKDIINKDIINKNIIDKDVINKDIINDINLNNNNSDNINNINKINDNNSNFIINNDYDNDKDKKDVNNNDYNYINSNVGSRNNSESLSNTNNNNYIQDRKPSEFYFFYSNTNSSLPLMGQSSNEGNISLYSNYSGPYEVGSSGGQIGRSTNDSEYTISCSTIKSNFSYERASIDSYFSAKKFELNVDIKKVLSLEDRRTTIMIKNIPNKFTKESLFNIIDKDFKSAYDILILPTDVASYKNFGYSFINFTSSYYIPYFYYLFNGKKWSSTNSLKICEITYSKIQGRNNLLSHYSNKIVFRNDEAKKYSVDQKYIIPNEYRVIFNSLYPNKLVEEHNDYFLTKMPF